MIELKTLGQQSVRTNGREVQGIAGHKQKFALLTYIALEGPVSRDHLLAMFWPERTEDRARHSLSQVLYTLRRELGGGALSAEGDLVFTDSVRVDVDRLERAAAEEDWETVVEHYAGPFLDQFVLSGAPEFERWQTQMRTRLARVAGRAFPRQIERQMRRGELREALATAASWVSLDPLQDEAQHIFITLLAQSGQRTAAIEQYESYRERLAKELEVEPLDGTIALIERIRAGVVPEYRPLRAPSTPRPSPGPKPKEPEAEIPPATDEPPAGSLWWQLWERRVPHVAAIYLLIVWLGTHLASEAVYWELVPDWILPAAVFILVLGLPLALLTAWAHEASDRGFGPDIRFWPRFTERIGGGQVGWFLTGIALVLAVLLAGVGGNREVTTQLRHRVLIFPFKVPPERNPLEGEDMATWIGATLEETAGIGWIDGWYRVSGTEVRAREARSSAIALGAAFWLYGRIAVDDDTVVTVSAQLHDVAGDSVLAHLHQSGPLDAGRNWVRREATQLVAELLPTLAEATGAGEPLQFTQPSDTPPAADSFLVAERAYRRAQYGEALRRYESALAADSAFNMAALKGSLAAGWLRRSREAGRLADLALRGKAFLEPSRAEFGRGLQQYWGGYGDSAVAHFRRAARLAPDWLEARAQLGEAYFHLPTSEAPADSLTRAAFLDVWSRNPEFHPVLYHLIEIAVRRGEIETAERLMDEFLRVESDTAMTRHAAQIMFECVRGSPPVVDWRRHMRDHPAAVYEAARSLAVGASQTGCARSAWRHIVEHDDTTRAFNWGPRFGAILGIAGLLAAENRGEDLVELRDQIADPHPRLARALTDVFVLAEVAGTDGLAPEVSRRIQELRSNIAGGLDNGHFYWIVGRWAAASGEQELAEALVDSLANRLTREEITWKDTAMARSLDAHTSLARGDTARALSLLEQLVPPRKERIPAGAMWPFESRPGDAVTLAELLYRRGEYTRAVEVAATLDSPARPPSDLMFLPRSLLVRSRAGRALGDADLVERMTTRLTDLGRIDLIELDQPSVDDDARG